MFLHNYTWTAIKDVLHRFMETCQMGQGYFGAAFDQWGTTKKKKQYYIYTKMLNPTLVYNNGHGMLE
jgi:hypothetical protein